MKCKLAAILSMGVLMNVSASSVLVVDFTRDDASNESSRTADSRTLNGERWNFSDTIYLLNSTGAGISNGQIYGGITTAWSVQTNYSPLVRFNRDRVHVQVRASSPANNKAAGMLLWKKADFISNATERLGFAFGDSLSVNLTQFAADEGGRELRFVVQQGGNYYVSRTAQTTNGTGMFSVPDASAETWAQVNTDDYTYGTFHALPVDHIEAVGVFFALSRTGKPVYFSFDDFRANATVVDDQFRASATTVDSGPETMGLIF